MIFDDVPQIKEPVLSIYENEDSLPFLCFVDFDDTLYLHRKHWTVDQNEEMEKTIAFNSYYKTEYLNIPLLRRLIFLKGVKPGITFIMLTAGTLSTVLDQKRFYLINAMSEVFGYDATDLFSDFVMVGLDKSDKLKYAKSYTANRQVNGLKVFQSLSHRVLLIDDNFLTCGDFTNHGYKAMTPQYFNMVDLNVDEVLKRNADKENNHNLGKTFEERLKDVNDPFGAFGDIYNMPLSKSLYAIRRSYLYYKNNQGDEE